MKKFNLKAKEMLLKNELKTITGGYVIDDGGDNCVDLCQSDKDCGPKQLDQSCMTIRFLNGCRAKRCVRNFEN